MSQTIKEQIGFLKQLQGIENQAHSLSKKINGIPEKLQEIDRRQAGFEQDIQTENQRIEEVKKEYRSHEADLQGNLSKIKKSNEKLGSVKNNKEYQAILKEIDDIKARNSEIEDQILQCIDLMESMEKNIKSRRRELDDFVAKAEIEKKHVDADNLESRKTLEALEKEKTLLTAKMDSSFLVQFKKTREIVGLTTIARVKDALCLGCNVRIPPQRYNELQRFESLQYCPNCHRIIYWENNERPE
jgi:uncharacterized protein